MKSRNSSNLHRLSRKYSDSDIPEPPQRNRRRSSNLAFIEKSAQIIQNYGALLKKLPYQFGDAEAYFKQTLRNYDDFDFKSLKFESKTNLRNHRSLDNLRGEKKKNHLGSGDSKDKSKTQLKAQSKKSATLVNSKSKDKFEEEEFDIFYSPSSQLTGENSQVMAEGEESPIPSDLPEESEPEADPVTEDTAPADPLAESEQLVAQASKEIDQLEQDTVPGGEVMGEEPGTNVGGEIDSAPTDEEGITTEEDVSESPPPPPEEKPPGDKPIISGKPSAEKPPAQKPSKPLEPVPETPEAESTKPPTENSVLKEVAECEAQCAEISAILGELRKRVAALLSKPKRSPEEDRELEDKQRLLNEKMQLLEQKTKKVEMLMSQFRGPSYDQPQTEDALPKVIICGLTENNMPKIIVCDGKKKKKKTTPKLNLPSQQMAPCPPCIVPASVMPKFAQRLTESYTMQERLAAENADLEGKRYQLQEDLLDKDHTVESLQRKLTSLQGEMRMIVKENNLLNDKLDKAQDSPRPRRKMPCGKGKGICPADVEGRLNEYSETTQQLEKQLSEMEDEVRNMQSELVAVRQERMHLEQHRRMMTCPNVCPPPTMSCPNAFGPCPGPPPCPGAPPCPGGHPCAPPCQRPPSCPACCPAPCNMNKGPSLEQQLREMREKYNYLQEDYKGKLTEVAGLRAEIDKMKGNSSDGESLRKIAEDKTRECAMLQKELKEMKKFASQHKEQTTELEQQLVVAKQRYREVKDELEEVRALVEEHKAQMEEYRNKYMQAQQTVEEQRRQIDMMELENARIGEQVNLEIQRVKNQFQEKLQELTPLPDILKATQKKLQEVQQMHLLAERKNEMLLKDLQTCRDKAGELELELERLKGNEKDGLGEVGQLRMRLEECSAKLAEALEDNDILKKDLADLQEHVEDTERELAEKAHEVAQLSAEVENVREESARQVARTKERCETIRRSMQLQITELERQLACCRALTRSAQKDRDEIRQKMQAQINNLNENFEDAQMRIRNLQGHVNFLKHSYTNVVPPADICNCGSANEPMNPIAGDGTGMQSMGDPLNRCNTKF